MPNIRIPKGVTKEVVFKAYLSDGVTEATGKTIALKIRKAAGAFADPAAGPSNLSEIANGWYTFTLGAGDTDTLGPLICRGTATGVDPTEAVFEVANAHNQGFDGVPDAVAGANTGLPVVGTQVPNANAGAAGGLFIAGTNAPVTIAGSGNALTLTSTGANGNGLAATGNGSGNGIMGTGGASGDGIEGQGGATNGIGMHMLGAGTGTGALFNSGAGASGDAVQMTALSTNGGGLVLQGKGTGDGMTATGGASAHGDGVHFVGGGNVTGAGVRIAGGATDSDLHLDNTSTNMVLAKTTNITGFNDIAATAIVSAGAITTAGGKVSEVALTDALTGYSVPPAMITAQDVRDAMKLAPTAGAPAAGSIDESINNLLARLGTFTGTGVNTVLGFLRAMANKAVGIATPTDLAAGGTFDNTTDSEEAIADAPGGGGLTAQQTRDAMKLAPTAGAPAASSIDDKLNGLAPGAAVVLNAEITEIHTT